MAGRDYLPRDGSKPNRDSHSRRALIESPPRHRIPDDRVSVHHRDIQTLILDNQRLSATQVALKQELHVALQDLRHLSAAAGKIKADRAAEVREVFEKAVKLEAEVRVVDELRAGLVKATGDIHKLNSENKELREKFGKIHGDIVKGTAKEQQYQMIKAEIEGMHKEIQKGRAAIEYEKKVYDSNLEQNEAMEQSRASMTREIEKLQADLVIAHNKAKAAAADAHKKAMAAAAAAATNTPGYGAGYGNAYPGPYVGHQGPGGVDPQYGLQHHMVNPQYAPATAPHGPYDMQHPHAHG